MLALGSIRRTKVCRERLNSTPPRYRGLLRYTRRPQLFPITQTIIGAELCDLTHPEKVVSRERGREFSSKAMGQERKLETYTDARVWAGEVLRRSFDRDFLNSYREINEEAGLDEDEQVAKQKVQAIGLKLLKSVGTRSAALSEPTPADMADLPAFVFDATPAAYGGRSLAMHFFEERYRQMMREITTEGGTNGGCGGSGLNATLEALRRDAEASLGGRSTQVAVGNIDKIGEGGGENGGGRFRPGQRRFVQLCGGDFKEDSPTPSKVTTSSRTEDAALGKLGTLMFVEDWKELPDGRYLCALISGPRVVVTSARVESMERDRRNGGNTSRSSNSKENGGEEPPGLLRVSCDFLRDEEASDAARLSLEERSELSALSSLCLARLESLISLSAEAASVPVLSIWNLLDSVQIGLPPAPDFYVSGGDGRATSDEKRDSREGERLHQAVADASALGLWLGEVFYKFHEEDLLRLHRSTNATNRLREMSEVLRVKCAKAEALVKAQKEGREAEAEEEEALALWFGKEQLG